jgi:hypothetical protein
MARCPYCLSPNPAGSSICHSCGRVVLGTRGMSMRVGAPIPGGELVHRARKGSPPGLNVRRGGKRRAKKKKSNIRTMVLVVAIAFLFLFTPAQERISNQLEKWLDSILDEFGPAREYPVYATYSAERNVNLYNPHGQSISFSYELPIPHMRTDFGISSDGHELTDSTVNPVVTLQDVTDMVVHTEGGQNSVIIPLNEEYLTESGAVALDSTSEVYWPPVGQNSNRCSVDRCVIWQGEIPPGEFTTLVVKYDVIGSSFTWWGGDRAPDEAPRSSLGFSMDNGNSGTLEDYERQGRLNTMFDQFGSHKQWYDRDPGPSRNWAIDGTNAVVIELANEIESSLSVQDIDDPYAFSHAAFIKIRDSIVYSQGLSPARSGASCIVDERGDCDEQSNAWMSLLRTRNIPAWYEFGPMTDGQFSGWEPHAWANAIFPFDTDWCEENEITLETCFIEGEVDVVNNRWLLHTPTTMTEWIETPSTQGDAAYDFYRPLSIGCVNCWTETWETVGNPEISGGTYRVPVRIGE